MNGAQWANKLFPQLMRAKAWLGGSKMAFENP
jgi:hypothetical protein